MTRRSWLLAVLALAFVFAWPMQVTGYNQNAHLALARAVAIHHVPYIDRALGEVGELSSGDVSRFEGHFYAAKAPGLAFVSVPPLLVLDAVGMRTTGDPTRILWALHLWGIVLPAVGLVLLLRRTGDALEPGYGAAAAATLGLATLLLPFSTLFFSHVPAATLGFAAFAIAFAERQRAPRLRLVFAAGLAAGLAVTFEYPLVFAAGIVGLYAVARGGVPRRALAYAAGGLLGVVPLLVFNWWAFGSPLHIAYQDYYADSDSEVGGVFGFGLPRPSNMYDLMFSAMGMLTLTPVVALGLVGAALAWRRWRAEMLVVLVVVGVYLLYNSSLRHASPFGGLGPPRYLFPLLPFVALPLTVAYLRLPLATLVLALVSAFQMLLATSTGALAMYDWDWLGRAADRVFAQNAGAFVEVTGWYTIVPFFVAAGVAAAAAAAATPRPVIAKVDIGVAAAALAAWAAVGLAADNPAGLPPGTGYVVAAVVAAAAGAAAVALVARHASQPERTLPRMKSTAEHSGHASA
jgi:hypothetical protein